ncbi:VOC family protein [Rhodococcus sp. KBS0724]|jgi:predicted 3-demethylubiquinone-9 3-methyltransferase (glyoxalase superfamily)|uniref:VOC family protein n=1 Tax=Rhodococcus sp. KBS0724 TaxID=1179674 RepID=UPI00110DC349|nr:VOC family protein [Rhodococcus sp. KBS0724]TSD46134.1 VOC family protein [Rhodococcus sp. KBS0724]
MPSITPCLWFDTQAEEAAHFYISVFGSGKILEIERYGEGSPSGQPAGSVMTVVFELDGQRFTGLNGGPMFTFSEAVSFEIPCADQAEVDHYWSALTEGGEESQCGWLKDKFGLSWQVVPSRLLELMHDPDRAKAQRVMDAMMQMKKIDVAELERAAL